MKVELNGLKFDSKKEAGRWLYLLSELAAGRIQFLRRQVIYRIRVNGIRVCNFVADFVYIEAGRQIVEDVKSNITRLNRAYRIKVKLMAAAFGIVVKET